MAGRNGDLVTANVQVGSTLPATYTFMGKLLLASLDPAELAQRTTPESFSDSARPNAVKNLAELKRQLAVIREQGYAIQDQELAQGLPSVSVAVHGDAPQPVAAVNIAVWSTRHGVAALRGPLHDQLRATADDITRRLRTS